MKKRMIMNKKSNITFKEGYDEFIYSRKIKNLREATIKHYDKTYRVLESYFGADTEISNITERDVHEFIIYTSQRNLASQTISSYIKDLATILHFFMASGWMLTFKISIPRADNTPVETYSDSEIAKLLKRPNFARCDFTELTNWAIVNFFLSTGIRLSSLINVRIKDIDFDNELCKITHTKNHKALIIPLNKKLISVIHEYLRYRGGSLDDYLFCNTYGEQINKGTLSRNLHKYNYNRGVSTTGIHRFRHTFAKKFILSGGSVYALEKLLGHSSLTVTEHYINLIVSDISSDINQHNILNEFERKRIKM